MITLIAANGRNQKKNHCTQQEKPKEAPIAHAGKVNPNRRKRPRILYNLAMPKKGAQTREQEPYYKKARCHQIRENPDIWICVMRKRIQQKQQREGENASGDNDQT
jgi:hypothetical protein